MVFKDTTTVLQFYVIYIAGALQAPAAWFIMVSSVSDKDKKFDKARELGNSTLLKKYKVSNYPEVTFVVDHLYDEMVRICDLKLNRKSSIDRLKHHIEFFCLNLYKTYCNDPTRVIAYSRDIHAYSGKKSRYKHKFGLSYRYSVEGGKKGKPVIGFLEEQDYIENFSGVFDKRDPRRHHKKCCKSSRDQKCRRKALYENSNSS